MRDIVKYSEDYRTLPFESIQLTYRRKLVLARIDKYNPSSILEVGCGTNPLFVDAISRSHTIIEPSLEFYSQAKHLAVGMDVELINGYLELHDFKGKKFDMVIAGSVLHEIENAAQFIAAIRNVCHATSVLHMNVPNAFSIHRILAKEMEIISDVFAQSNNQENMQQSSTVYDMVSLIKDIVNAGFYIKDKGSIFIKPFTHKQMQELIDIGFISESMLDGFDRLVHYLPDFGSEIWVEASPL